MSTRKGDGRFVLIVFAVALVVALAVTYWPVVVGAVVVAVIIACCVRVRRRVGRATVARRPVTAAGYCATHRAMAAREANPTFLAADIDAPAVGGVVGHANLGGNRYAVWAKR